MKGARQFLRAWTAGLIIGGVLAVFSCKAGKTVTGSGDSSAGTPHLLSLEFDYPLELSPAFSPARYHYEVELRGDIPPLRVKALGAPGYSVSFIGGEYFMPRHGALAVLRVSAPDARAVQYVISFFDPEAARPLPQAKLAAIAFSEGALPDFSPDVYDYTLEAPVGVSRITAAAGGAQEGSYITYTPGMSVEMRDGIGKMEIGVAADGYAARAYTVTFITAKPRESALDGISLSAGTMTTRDGAETRFDPGAAGEQYIAVPKETRRLVVYADKKHAWDKTAWTIQGERRGGESGVIEDPVSLDGAGFSITVNEGAGFSEREYQFKIYTVEEAPAFLENILVSGGTLWQREEDGGDGASVFLPRRSVYNLNFAHGAAELTIRADAPSGVTVRINGRDSGVETVRNPSASRPPLRISAHAPGMLTTTYMIYFVKTNPPAAELAALFVSGGGLSPAFAPDIHAYTVSARADALILYAEGARAGFELVWTPERVIAPRADTEARVRVEGGPDWTAAEYTLSMRRENVRLPRLIALKVGGRTIELDDGRLVYQAVIEAAEAGAADVVVDWAVDESEAERVWYSLDGGESWRENAEKDGFSGELFLLPSGAAVILVKIITYDGNAAVYYLEARRQR